MRVYNAGLHDFVSNATVLLVEKHYRNRIYDPYGLGPHISCKTISEKETDINGTVVFDNEKLKTNKNTRYALFVKKAWDMEKTYTCDYAIEFKNETEIYLDDKRRSGGFQFQINNLFAAAISGDSITIRTTKLIYPEIYSDQSYLTGFKTEIIKAYDNTMQSASVLTDLFEDNGTYLLQIKKRKSGLITNSTDTFKSYPNRSNIIQINW